MSEELSLMLQEYAREPVNYFVMDDATISFTQPNNICGDSATVYLKITDTHIEAASHAGEEALHTSVAASLLMEELPGKDLQTVLTRWYTTMQAWWFSVSPRRKRAAVTALLAARNAIHLYLQDGKVDTFEELLES